MLKRFLDAQEQDYKQALKEDPQRTETEPLDMIYLSATGSIWVQQYS